jgi:DNA-binding IscR family transcriptional regulator
MVKLLDITAAVEADIKSACFSCGGRGSSGYTVSSCSFSGAIVGVREAVKLTFRHSLP